MVPVWPVCPSCAFVAADRPWRICQWRDHEVQDTGTEPCFHWQAEDGTRASNLCQNVGEFVAGRSKPHFWIWRSSLLLGSCNKMTHLELREVKLTTPQPLLLPDCGYRDIFQQWSWRWFFLRKFFVIPFWRGSNNSVIIVVIIIIIIITVTITTTTTTGGIFLNYGVWLIPLQGCRLVDLIWIRAGPLLVVLIALFNEEQTVPKITQVLCRSSPGFLGQRPVGDVPWCAHFWLIKIHLKIFLSLTLQDSSMAMGHYGWFLIDARISWIESRCWFLKTPFLLVNG